jgi:adenylate cyclase, class 2
MPHLTHHEIEIKLRVSDLSSLLRRLRQLRASSHGRVFEQNTIYDTHDAALYRLGRLIRLRVETPSASRLIPAGRHGALVTSKVPVPPSGAARYKVKLERELPLQDPRRWPAILRSLGFRPAFRYEKYRSTFRLPGLSIDLDETPVGIFLELEGSPRAIDHVARALGYSPNDYFRGTYWDLYAAECRRRGRMLRNMVFSS